MLLFEIRVAKLGKYFKVFSKGCTVVLPLHLQPLREKTEPKRSAKKILINLQRLEKVFLLPSALKKALARMERLVEQGMHVEKRQKSCRKFCQECRLSYLCLPFANDVEMRLKKPKRVIDKERLLPSCYE